MTDEELGQAVGDFGVSNERTALAWQRTGLSLVAGSAIILRLTWSDLGVLALVALAIAMVLGTWIFVESRGRYAHDAGARRRARSRGGRAPFALALSTALLATTELTMLLVRWTG
ncbi:DUF202 domain-containing protein [Aeromicrobium duanguangcaii]|uniref:DUF202 domain-containing protein n=1 Tax=Aeromicrobium duanguangcaii TaxID=2968086 RepID=UPI0034E20374